MHDTRRTLLPRVGAILRAKQYVVFFAIALYALDFAAPLVSGGLRRGGSLADVLEHLGAPVVDAVAGRSWAIAALALGVTALTAFFRAGYIRSIVGRFHAGPVDGRQFWRLLGLQVVIEAVVAGTVVLGDRLPAEPSGLDWATTLALFAGMMLLFALTLVIAYSDYAVVISGLSLWRALARSWQVVRLNALVTVTLFVAVTAFGGLVTSAAAAWMTGLPQALPAMVIEVVVFGAVVFVADVVLIVVYLDTMETGRLKETRSGG